VDNEFNGVTENCTDRFPIPCQPKVGKLNKMTLIHFLWLIYPKSFYLARSLWGRWIL